MIKVLRGPLRSVWALQNQTLAPVGEPGCGREGVIITVTLREFHRVGNVRIWEQLVGRVCYKCEYHGHPKLYTIPLHIISMYTSTILV